VFIYILYIIKIFGINIITLFIFLYIHMKESLPFKYYLHKNILTTISLIIFQDILNRIFIKFKEFFSLNIIKFSIIILFMMNILFPRFTEHITIAYKLIYTNLRMSPPISVHSRSSKKCLDCFVPVFLTVDHKG